MIYTAFNEAQLEPVSWQDKPHGAKSFNLLYRRDDNRDCPRRNEPWYVRQGLQQTASGYGGKLNTGRMIHFNGRWHRVYVMCYGNSGSAYFISKGRTIFI